MRIAVPQRAALALLLVLGGCTTQVGRREVDQPAASPAVQTRPDAAMPSASPPIAAPQPVPTRIVRPPVIGNAPQTLAESNPNPAVLALSQQADAARKAGHPEQAESALGRALRIEPRNAFVWQSLAALHLSQKLYELAENEAQKSTSLGRGNLYLEAANWRIVADARQARGDAGGATQARAQADEAQRRLPQPQ